MRRIILILLSSALLLCGCSSNENAETVKNKIVFNTPSDSTINGYLPSGQTVSKEAITSMPDVITASEAAVVDNKPSSNSLSYEYCGNANSKLFHRSTCSFAVSMREENKTYLSDRAEFISNGYSPCSRCKP